MGGLMGSSIFRQIVLLLIIVLLSLQLRAQSFGPFIGAWITPTPPAHLIIDNSTVWLAEVTTSVTNTKLLNKSNWVITDGTVPLTIYSVERVTTIDGIPVTYTKLVAIRTSRANYKTEYTITLSGVGSGWYFYNGFQSQKPGPTVEFNK
jgi:hypothetical protein